MKRLFETDHLVRDLKGRSVRGGVEALGAQAGKLVLQLGSTVILARLLSPVDYGIFGLAAVVTGFLGLFHDMGLSVVTIQREKITVMPGPPAIYQSMLAFEGREKYDTSSLRLAVTGAAPTPVELGPPHAR